MASVVHVTHEAVHKAGGIGAVLEGLITAPSYQRRVERTVLLGPLLDPAAAAPLGADGAVIYDNFRGIWSAEVGPALQRVEQAWGVRLVYGRRPMHGPAGRVDPEVVLVDVGHPPAGLDRLKFFLYERFGLRSDRYESTWEFEQYLRLAEPGYDAVRALLGSGPGPCVLIAHEFMGLPTALKARLAAEPQVRTVFYAHEVATVRRLVEYGPGRDVGFYNALRACRAAGAYLEEVYGPQDDYFKHALVRQAWRCDGIFAVGDRVVDELRFLGPEFGSERVELVYNGVPAERITTADRAAARDKLERYAEALLHFRPDLYCSHVSRLVPSKGLWRDLLVLGHLDGVLAAQGRRALFVVLASEAGRRDPDRVQSMVDGYGWPLVHREGFPDLSPNELAFDLQARAFNARRRAVRVLFVNQFGWDPVTCGPPMPADMGFADLRRGIDVELGQSIYEPFGIAQLEPLSFGAVCVVSDACGSVGFLERSAGPDRPASFVLGEYTRVEPALSLEAARAVDAATCARAEELQSRRVAAALAERLGGSGPDLSERLEEGYALAAAMSWERVAADYFLPALERLRPAP